MGKGDRKTRKGKIFAKSYGNARPHTETASSGATPAPVKKAAAPAKAAAKKAAPAKKKAG